MMAIHGGCYCGAIRYSIDGPVRQVIACHCQQCQKFSGSFVMASAAYVKDLSIEDKDKNLSWFASSEKAERAFCANCGSQLFWQGKGDDQVSIMAGSLDDKDKLKVNGHIFVEYKSDYYSIPERDLICYDNCYDDSIDQYL